jgi:hypothetical protein
MLRNFSSPTLSALVALLALCGAARAADPLPAPAADATARAASAAGPAVAPTGASAPAARPAATPASAVPGGPGAALPAALDDRIQDLKNEVILLNRDLLVLEEELLFPANTQIAVFVSMDVGKLFELDSVQVKLDNKLVASYLYTPLEVQALHRGGMQRLYLGNLRGGEHELVAVFTGKGPHDRDYKRATTLLFDKGSDPRYIELRISDVLQKLQPEFDVKVWQ